MTLTEAIILGIVQGLTEPLPVSSSAHLVIIPALIPGFHQPGVFFDVVLHLGTLVSVVFFLRKDIAGIVASLLPETGFTGALTTATGEERIANRRLLLFISVATVLTGMIGIFFKDRIERLFESVETTAVMLLITGLLLFLSDRIKKGKREKRNESDGWHRHRAGSGRSVDPRYLAIGFNHLLRDLQGTGERNSGPIFLFAFHSGDCRRRSPEIDRYDANSRRGSDRSGGRFPVGRRYGIFCLETSLCVNTEDRP